LGYKFVYLSASVKNLASRDEQYVFRKERSVKKMVSIRRKAILIILDGWGIGQGGHADAIAQASTPTLDSLRAHYPHGQLQASGEAVGLPEGQMGNSEVGHLNIGAGRVVFQDLVRINRDIKSGAFKQNAAFLKAFSYAKEHGKAVHFLGLVSDGGVHSLDSHLYALCDMATELGVERAYVHAFTDGRDTDPKSGLGFLRALEAHINGGAARLVSVVGRYYAMDRDKRWERVKEAYDMLVLGKGEACDSLLAGVEKSYAQGVTDEFIKPLVLRGEDGSAVGRISPGDVVICFNYRTDRLRELTIVLTQEDMPDYAMQTLPLYYVTMTRYEASFKDVHVAYDKEDLKDTLGEFLSRQGATQLRIAETEKYAHVTFFFSGGREAEFPGEHRILIPSPRVATYDLQPEMSANEVTGALLDDLEKRGPDFVCLNFANGDMVGHTGVYEAIEKAVRTVDACLGRIVPKAQSLGYDILIIADHGNADKAENADGTPNTAHSLNPVPIIAVTDQYKLVENGVLADVAPTVLQLMGLPKPDAMTGKGLLR